MNTNSLDSLDNILQKTIDIVNGINYRFNSRKIIMLSKMMISEWIGINNVEIVAGRILAQGMSQQHMWIILKGHDEIPDNTIIDILYARRMLNRKFTTLPIKEKYAKIKETYNPIILPSDRRWFNYSKGFIGG